MVYWLIDMVSKRASFFFLVFLLLIGTTYLLIQFAKGYRIDFSQKTLRPTGLLVATSVPDGGQIFIDGKLTSATNTTLYLVPGSYNVEIKKDGFHPWEKTLKIEKELVTKTDAWLFLLVPDFHALTFTGAAKPLLSPDGSKIVYQVAGEIPEKNGLWVLDLDDLPFGLSREPKLIVKSVPQSLDFSKATYNWSPDSRQILVTFSHSTPLESNTSSKSKILKTAEIEKNYLLDAGNFTLNTNLVDMSMSLAALKQQWQQEEAIKQEQRLTKLPPELAQIIKEKTQNALFSPDETKVLYTATASAIIPDHLIPAIPSYSKQPQERELKAHQTYVYDLKEDRNYMVFGQAIDIGYPTSITTPQRPWLSWFPTSRHLLLVEKDRISVLEYEGTNQITIYAGSYQFPFAFPFPSGNKLLILTTLSSNSSPNLYDISLR